MTRIDHTSYRRYFVSCNCGFISGKLALDEAEKAAAKHALHNQTLATPTTGLARSEHSWIDGEPDAKQVPTAIRPANAEAVAKKVLKVGRKRNDKGLVV